MKIHVDFTKSDEAIIQGEYELDSEYDAGYIAPPIGSLEGDTSLYHSHMGPATSSIGFNWPDTSMKDKVEALENLDRQDGLLAPLLQGSWSKAVEHRRCIVEKPTIEPHADPTIDTVMRDREVWVQRVNAAIVNVNNTNDRKGSRDLQNFEQGKYDKDLVASISRVIFVSLTLTILRGLSLIYSIDCTPGSSVLRLPRY